MKLIEFFFGPVTTPPEGWIRYILGKLWFTVRFFSIASVRSKLARRRVMTNAQRQAIWVPLVKLEYGHPVRFHWSDRKLKQRVRSAGTWLMVPDYVLRDTTQTREFSIRDQMRWMGSATPIRVVREAGRYVVYDGNGRVAALKAVCGERPVLVEVELLTLQWDTHG